MSTKNTSKNILHVGIRINSINIAHTRISIFQGLTYPENNHKLPELSRGCSGTLTIDTAAAEQIIGRFPGIVRLSVTEDAIEMDQVPQWLQKLFCKVNKVNKFEFAKLIH